MQAIAVVWSGNVSGCWQIRYRGSDGLQRPTGEITVPAEVPETELVQYIADLCDEWATRSHREVVPLR
ncbi:hypothetical protein EYC98_04990 [Halieaceae bacterium IMCC14734]|uniref:DUF7661 domain-containing protein n=1 Tax=Candidatus Litorirhabdus singularis TaxID=2518993 RepID=A0ABT3TFN5_9GAMM|nr:hypothetical protein [Candidatus Litorirhabdus singularis]MCX2980222.1 hypothetical protein [Candidatus Litorirhabdus singularis]